MSPFSVFLTETWLKPECDDFILKSTIPNESQIPKGGGIAALFSKNVDCTEIEKHDNYESFEHLLVKVVYDNTQFLVCTIYRIPPSKENKLSKSLFLDEFSSLLEKISISKEKIIFLGDFNIHWDDKSNSETIRFRNLVDSFNLQQHVEFQTHELGHTLDLILSRTDENIVKTCYETEYISDHIVINTILAIKKPNLKRKTIKFRKYKDIPIKEFSEEIVKDLRNNANTENVNDLVDSYNRILSEKIDKFAPEKEKCLILRENVSYFSDDVKTAKIEKRKTERLWRKSMKNKRGNVSDLRKQLQTARTKLANTLETSKKTYYMDKIENCGKNQKQLYQILNSLLKRSCEQDLPDHISDSQLVNKFNGFFVDKIVKIRENLSSSGYSYHPEPESDLESTLQEFVPVSEQTIADYISKSSNATCDSDPIPTWLLKKCKETLTPTITSIVNASLKSGTFPSKLKHALVRPKLKKENLDKNEMKNFRPVSNIPFISKIIEKAVIAQLTTHMISNNLIEPLQSAYRPNHSTETALLRIQNDILLDLDNRRGVILVLLDLSAAFDTIDHSILIDRLRNRIGLQRNALDWFKSYHTKRTQSVLINGIESTPIALDFGAPQGSLMGAEEYKIYTTTIGDIIRRHNLKFHIYADDGQLHVSFILTDKEDLQRALSKIQCCTSDIKQ